MRAAVRHLDHVRELGSIVPVGMRRAVACARYCGSTSAAENLGSFLAFGGGGIEDRRISLDVWTPQR